MPRVLTTPTDLGEEVEGVQRGEPDLAARTLRSQAHTIRAVIARRARLHVAGHLWSPHLAQSLQTAITSVHPDVEARVGLGDLRDLCQAHAHHEGIEGEAILSDWEWAPAVQVWLLGTAVAPPLPGEASSQREGAPLRFSAPEGAPRQPNIHVAGGRRLRHCLPGSHRCPRPGRLEARLRPSRWLGL